ncbi:MAG: hypothetical protein PHF57_02860 [Methanoregula sp.]|jgi:hypothetical protein|nr:hypothetical protein [Methanoregula sp.]MDD5187127.1 hypothetical protein [Methanoregula sp.]
MIDFTLLNKVFLRGDASNPGTKDYRPDPTAVASAGICGFPPFSELNKGFGR